MRALSKGARAAVVISAGALVLAACGSAAASGKTNVLAAHTSAHSASYVPPSDYGKLPKATNKIKSGGTITVGQLAGTTPNYIFPITPAANLSVYTADFEDFMWRPIFWGPNGDSVPSIDYTDSLATKPTFTNDNKTLTIHFKNWNWSDGKPITATDCVFDYWLFKAAVTLSPANEGDYTPGLYPDNVTSIKALNSKTLQIKFNKTYNQDFLLFSQIGDLVPLPAQAWARTSATSPILPATPAGFENLKTAEAIYNYLSGASTSESTYTTNPLWKTVDGPFKLQSFTPATGAFTIVPNPKYSGHHPYAAKIEFLTFQSTSSEFNQLLSNNLDVSGVDFSDIAKVKSIEGHYNVWGGPNFGWQYVVYNFKDHTGDFNNIIDKLYIRQALAHLQNESAVIKSRGVFDGAAGPAYGPVPAAPPSPLAPSTAKKNPYPFSISTAKTILTKNGWKVAPGGTTRCEKAGTKSGECGYGIPKGTALSWPLVYANEPPATEAEDEAWASNAKKIGISMSLSSKTFNFMISNYDDVSSPKNDNSWAMEDFGGFTGIEYPTTNEVFNTTGSFDLGGFNNPSVNTAIHNSIYSLSDDAVKSEAELIGKVMPGLFQPNPDLIYAFSKKISAKSQYFDNLSQYTTTPEYWYFVK